MLVWGPEWGEYANDPDHDHMACSICLPERLKITAERASYDDELNYWRDKTAVNGGKDQSDA